MLLTVSVLIYLTGKMPVCCMQVWRPVRPAESRYRFVGETMTVALWIGHSRFTLYTGCTVWRMRSACQAYGYLPSRRTLSLSQPLHASPARPHPGPPR